MPWLYRQKGSRFWWLGYRVGGRQVLRSTGKLDRREAEKELATVNTMLEAQKASRLTDELYRLLTGRLLPNVTLLDSLRDWLKDASRTCAPTTSTRYQVLGDAIAKFTNATDKAPLLRDVTTQQIRAFLQERLVSVSASTANLERKILSSFFLRAMRQGELTVNPVLPIKKFKAGRDDEQGRRAFTLDELSLIYGKAPDDFWRYMILAGFYCGQRMGDLICLVYGAVDFGENVIRLRQGKTGRSVTVPMARQLLELLQKRKDWKTKAADEFLWPEQAAQYLARGPGAFSNAFYDQVLTPSGLVIPRTRHKLKDGRGKKRVASPVSFHSLRHTFVTVLRATGGNQAVAKELAGHSSDAVNDLYTHMPLEAMQSAIKRLPEIKEGK